MGKSWAICVGLFLQKTPSFVLLIFTVFRLSIDLIRFQRTSRNGTANTPLPRLDQSNRPNSSNSDNFLFPSLFSSGRSSERAGDRYLIVVETATSRSKRGDWSNLIGSLSLVRLRDKHCQRVLEELTRKLYYHLNRRNQTITTVKSPSR